LPAPSSDDLIDGELAQYGLSVDWRAINREQAIGFPSGLRTEDGLLIHTRRIASFNVAAVEDDDEEPFN
jgi:hypothetical protein